MRWNDEIVLNAASRGSVHPRTRGNDWASGLRTVCDAAAYHSRRARLKASECESSDNVCPPGLARCGESMVAVDKKGVSVVLHAKVDWR